MHIWITLSGPGPQRNKAFFEVFTGNQALIRIFRGFG